MATKKRKAEDIGEGEGTKRARKVTARTENPDNIRITRDMTVDAARKAVFNTAELFEQIFLEIPIKSIFTARSVCQQFQDIVATSKQLRRKLWLWTSLQTADSWFLEWSDRPITGPGYIPEAYFVTRDRLPPPPRGFAYKSSMMEVYMPVEPNLLLTQAEMEPGLPIANRVYRHSGELVTLDIGGSPMAPGSWEKTYATNPPCIQARIQLRWRINSKPPVGRSVTRRVQSDTGLTLGDIFDAAVVEKGRLVFWGSVDKSLRNSGRGNRSLADILPALEEDKGKRAVIEETKVTLLEVIVPSQEESASMRDYGDSRQMQTLCQ